MYSKTDTVTTEDYGIDDLVDLFKGLRKDMGDQKAETARLKAETVQLKTETVQLKAETVQLNRSLRQEQEERKADSVGHKEETARLNRSHKEETARLNRLLLLEEENRKDENKSLLAETRRLKATITKEREERMAVVADLEGTIERQDARLEEYERELRNAKEQHDNDMRDISEVCTTVLCSYLLLHMSILAHSKVGPHPSPDSFGLQP